MNITMVSPCTTHPVPWQCYTSADLVLVRSDTQLPCQQPHMWSSCAGGICSHVRGCRGRPPTQRSHSHEPVHRQTGRDGGTDGRTHTDKQYPVLVECGRADCRDGPTLTLHCITLPNPSSSSICQRKERERSQHDYCCHSNKNLLGHN